MTATAKPMTKAQLSTALSEKLDITKKQVNLFFEALNDVAYKETKKNGAFTLPGIGKLVLQKRKARKGRNPATGEEIKIKAKTVVKFKDAIIPPKK